MIQKWAPGFGITNADDLILPVAIIFAAFALSAGAIRLFNLWINSDWRQRLAQT